MSIVCPSPRLWEALGNSGSLWEAVGSFGRLWKALVCFGRLWEALVGFGGCERLLEALEDNDPDIRIVACKAWGTRLNVTAKTALLKTVRSDQDSDVQSAALRALGNFKGQEVFKELRTALESRDPAVQYAGIQGLRKLTGEDWGEDPETWIAGLEGQSPDIVHDGQESFFDALHPRNLIR